MPLPKALREHGQMHNAKGRSKVTRVRLDQTESEPELARYLCFRHFRPGTITQGALGRVNQRHWQQTNTASRPQWPVLMPWQRALPPVLLRGLLAMLFFRCPAHRVQPLYAPSRDLQRAGTVFFSRKEVDSTSDMTSWKRMLRAV